MISVTMHASEAVFANNALVDGQADELHLGDFAWVELTYQYLRVSPDGEHLAVFDGQYWVVGCEFERDGLIIRAEGVGASDGARFSDVMLTVKS